MSDFFNIKSDGARRRIKFNPRPKLPKDLWKRNDHFPDLSDARGVCFDVETKDPHLNDFGPGWGRNVGHVIGVAIGTDDGYQSYYPIRHEDGASENFQPEKVFDYLNAQLQRPEQKKFGHNMGYDLGWLAQEGVTVKGPLWDSRIAEKLLDYYAKADLESSAGRYDIIGKDSKDLYRWCWEAFGQTAEPKTDRGLRDNAMKNLYRCPPAIVGAYGMSDVRMPIELALKQKKLLNRAGLWEVFDMECRLLPLLTEMRMAGVSVDMDAAEQAHDAINIEVADMQKKIDLMVGRRGLNTKSPTEMEKVFEELGINPERTPTGQVSLASNTLREMSHPLAAAIIEIEELKKYNSTFIENAILESSVNGKIYGEFDPFGTKTGRFSSKNPNLQQIPSRNELAKVIRRIFVPDESEWYWRKYDYASVENRVFAHYAVGEAGEKLRQQYIDDPLTDYHDWCLDLVAPIAGWDISTPKKYKAKRKPIKNINFGIVYGLMAKSLGAQLGISFHAAKDLLESYHGALPHVKDTMDFLSGSADELGYSETILGRKVKFDQWEPNGWSNDPRPPMPRSAALTAYGFGIRKAGLYKATNYTIQGTAAEMMKMAMVQCYEQGVFDITGIPRMTIHDELDFNDRGGADAAFLEVVRIMETAVPLSVPIIVDGERGKNWSDLEDIPRAS